MLTMRHNTLRTERPRCPTAPSGSPDSARGTTRWRLGRFPISRKPDLFLGHEDPRTRSSPPVPLRGRRTGPGSGSLTRGLRTRAEFRVWAAVSAGSFSRHVFHSAPCRRPTSLRSGPLTLRLWVWLLSSCRRGQSKVQIVSDPVRPSQGSLCPKKQRGRFSQRCSSSSPVAEVTLWAWPRIIFIPTKNKQTNNILDDLISLLQITRGSKEAHQRRGSRPP